MKRRQPEPEPASRDAIKKNYDQFITNLPKRYRSIESGYNRSLYAVMADCATLALLAAEEPDIAEKIRNGRHWTNKRQKCPNGEYIKLVVHHVLQPEGKNEQSKASKWTAVIEHLSSKGDDGVSIVEALIEGGGIEDIYAETTGRNAARAKSVAGKASERIEADSDCEDDEAEAEADHDEEDVKHTKPLKSEVLRIILKPMDLDTVLNSKVVVLTVTNKGSSVPSKPEGFKRVVGRIKRVVK